MESSRTIRTGFSASCANHQAELARHPSEFLCVLCALCGKAVPYYAKSLNTESREKGAQRNCRCQRVSWKSAANCEIVSCSARASGDRLASRKMSSVRAPNRARRLLRSVFLFCAKHSLTKSRNAFSSPTEFFARAPGMRKLTSAEATLGGGRNAPGGIRNAISGRLNHCETTERSP